MNHQKHTIRISENFRHCITMSYSHILPSIIRLVVKLKYRK